MLRFSPPEYVSDILSHISANGFKAFLVGGCVRDMLLGYVPQDWDIATSALPTEIMGMFPHSRPTGLKHGTVTVICDSGSVEVTTFRTESNYSDHRHPDSVCFASKLESDLSRRDFTINAMAITEQGIIIDPFGGQKDLEAGLVRCVGNQLKRFDEDALRMLRAFRFSSRLGFELEAQTLAAIYEKAYLASTLACERIRDELEKLLLSPHPEGMCDVISVGLLDRFLIKRSSPDKELVLRIALLPPERTVRWIALSFLLKSSGALDSVATFLTALKSDTASIRYCEQAVTIMEGYCSKSASDLKRLLYRYGPDTVRYATICRDTLFGKNELPKLQAVLDSGECFCLKQLAVSGRDLISLGFNGREVGEKLEELLFYVIDNPNDNERETLLYRLEWPED